MPLINRVIVGCCPTGIPPILINDDNEKRRVFNTLYPAPVEKKCIGYICRVWVTAPFTTKLNPFDICAW